MYGVPMPLADNDPGACHVHVFGQYGASARFCQPVGAGGRAVMPPGVPFIELGERLFGLQGECGEGECVRAGKAEPGPAWVIRLRGGRATGEGGVSGGWAGAG